MTRVGLCLGAGGITGGSFHGGVLSALGEATGWDARDADIVVGTSAGSLTGAMLRLGVGAADLAARATGRPLSAEAQRLLARFGGTIPQVPQWRPPAGRPEMASPEAVWRSLLRPMQARPGTMLAGLLPEGGVSTDVITQNLGRMFDAWPDRPFWAVAVCLEDGRRTAFGRDGAPPASVGEAVAASCAIPGFFTPPVISGRRYVDGGVHSICNLDLLARADPALDLVIVSSPMSHAGRQPAPGPDGMLRRFARLQLEREIRRLRRRGTSVVAFHPTARDRATMGLNPMDPERRGAVLEQVRASTAARLEHADVRRMLARLPGR